MRHINLNNEIKFDHFGEIIHLSQYAVRLIGVIEAVSSTQEPVRLEALARMTGMSRATAYRLLDSLCAAGVLLREPKGAGFSPGPRLCAASLNLLSHGQLRNARHAMLQALVSRLRETCNFTTYHQGAVLYVDRVEADWPVRLTLQPGSTTPIHSTSSGKLYLALMRAKERRRFLHDMEIPRHTAKTITDPAALELEMREIRRTRVAFDDQGYLDGLVSVAVPVYGVARSVLGAVSVHGPLSRLSLARATAIVPELRRAAAELSDAYRKLVELS